MEALDGVVGHIEGETDEQGGKDIQNKFAADVYGASIIMLEGSDGDGFELSWERHCECPMIFILVGCGLDVSKSCVNVFDLLQGLFSFAAVQPDLLSVIDIVNAYTVPILVCGCGCAGTDLFENILRGVGVRVARRSTVTLEIIDQSFGSFASISKIDGFSPFLKKKQTVKLLKEDSTWLMDGAQNRLSSIGQFSQELHHPPGSLTIESRRGFITKHQYY